MKIKESHTKMDDIHYTHLSKQTYLKSKKLFPDRAKLLFKFRTHMVDVKNNFKTMYNNQIECPLCKIEILKNI